MAKAPTITAPLPGASQAAASFADGHVDQVAPTVTANPLDGSNPLETIRQNEHVALEQDVLDPGMLGKTDVLDDEFANGFILLVCRTPGFRRGGMSHPSRAEYPLNSFTREQLDAFAAEPQIEMVTVGGEPFPREKRIYGRDQTLRSAPLDPLLAGRAAEAAISEPPNRSKPGARNAAAGDRR